MIIYERKNVVLVWWMVMKSCASFYTVLYACVYRNTINIQSHPLPIIDSVEGNK